MAKNIASVSKAACNIGVRIGLLERTYCGLGPVQLESNLASIGGAVVTVAGVIASIFIARKAVKDYESDKVRPLLL